jgi:hypothetical protein
MIGPASLSEESPPDLGLGLRWRGPAIFPTHGEPTINPVDPPIPWSRIAASGRISLDHPGPAR